MKPQEIVDFDWSEIAEHERPEFALADELTIEFGLSAALALRVAKHIKGKEDHAPCGLFASLVRRMITSIATARLPRLEARAWQMAIGIRESNGDSMRSAASQCGVTVEAISLRAEAIRRELGIKPNDFNKTERAVETYKERNRPRR